MAQESGKTRALGRGSEDSECEEQAAEEGNEKSGPNQLLLQMLTH